MTNANNSVSAAKKSAIAALRAIKDRRRDEKLEMAEAKVLYWTVVRDDLKARKAARKA